VFGKLAVQLADKYKMTFLIYNKVSIQ